MIACPMCGVRYERASRACANCGAPLPGWDGVEVPAAGEPDLDRIVDERARMIVQYERDAEAERLRREAQRDQLQKEVARARALRDGNLREPPTALGSIARSIRRIALATLIFGLFPGTGLMVHMFLFPLLGVSPAAPVCPLVCDGCSPWARTFFRNYEGDWQEKNGRMGYAFVCENPRIPIDDLGTNDVEDDPMNTKLQPYMLNSFTVWMAEVAICVPALALLFGPIGGLRRRARVLRERGQREADLAEAEKRLRVFEGSLR
jgi:hypothetical protein